MSRPLTYLALLLTLLVGLAPLDADAKDKPRIAVLELQGELPTNSLMLLSDKVRAGVLDATQGRGIVVMSRENMAVLAKDMGLDLSCIEGACEVETGRNIGAAYVVSGAVTQMGGVWLCSVKVHQTQSGALVATGDTEARSPLSLRKKIPPLVAGLMNRALGRPGPTANVQLGGEAKDFAQLAADARRAGGTASAPTPGEASVELGAGGDFDSLVAQAAAKEAERERMEVALEAERKRLAAEEARRKAALEVERKRIALEERVLKARIDAERRRRIQAARQKLLRKAVADLKPLAPLLEGPMTKRTKAALNAYLNRYRTAKITVDGTTESVTIPGVAQIDRALATEAAREDAALLAAQRRAIADAKAKLIAQAQQHFAKVKPWLQKAPSEERQAVLEGYVTRYGSAKIRVGGVVEQVDVPGVAEVRLQLRPRCSTYPSGTAVPQSATGFSSSITIKSVPSGLTARINGRAVDTTPILDCATDAVSMMVAVDIPGEGTVEKKVRVYRGQNTSVTLKAPPRAGPGADRRGTPDKVKVARKNEDATVFHIVEIAGPLQNDFFPSTNSFMSRFLHLIAIDNEPNFMNFGAGVGMFGVHVFNQPEAGLDGGFTTFDFDLLIRLNFHRHLRLMASTGLGFMTAASDAAAMPWSNRVVWEIPGMDHTKYRLHLGVQATLVVGYPKWDQDFKWPLMVGPMFRLARVID